MSLGTAPGDGARGAAAARAASMEVASVVLSASISSMPCAAIRSDADSSDDWIRISRHSDDSAATSSSSLDGCAEPRRLGGGAGGAASKVAADGVGRGAFGRLHRRVRRRRRYCCGLRRRRAAVDDLLVEDGKSVPLLAAERRRGAHLAREGVAAAVGRVHNCGGCAAAAVAAAFRAVLFVGRRQGGELCGEGRGAVRASRVAPPRIGAGSVSRRRAELAAPRAAGAATRDATMLEGDTPLIHAAASRQLIFVVKVYLAARGISTLTRCLN